MGSTDRVVQWRGGSLDELMGMLSGPALAARIEVLVGDGAEKPASVAGEVHLVAGGIADVISGSLRGDEALDHLKQLAANQFRVEPRVPEPATGSIVPPGPEEGSLKDRPLAGLMRYCEDYVMTCLLEVWRGNQQATITYRRGEITATAVEGSDAPERLPEVMTWTDGHYRIVLPPLVLPAPPRATKVSAPVVTRPSEPVRPVAAEPKRPSEPARPVVAEPKRPSEPVRPVAATEPKRPSEPVRPVVEAKRPSEPVRPVVEAARPPEPARPVVEAKRPSEPVRPAEPVRPSEPVRPVVEAKRAPSEPQRTLFGYVAPAPPRATKESAPRETIPFVPPVDAEDDQRSTKPGMQVDVYDRSTPERVTDVGVPAMPSPTAAAPVEPPAPVIPTAARPVEAPAKQAAPQAEEKPSRRTAEKDAQRPAQKQSQKQSQKESAAEKSASGRSTKPGFVPAKPESVPTVPGLARDTRQVTASPRTPRRVAVRRRTLSDLPVFAHVALGLALGLAIVGAYWVAQGLIAPH